MNNQYLFNVMYYEGLYSDKLEESIKKANDRLLEYRYNDEGVPTFIGPIGTCTIKMKTVYPGLLIGTGNPHQSSKSSEEIKLGFTLDYTTGLPYIPGSTVKGVIRAIFKEADNKKSDKPEIVQAKNEAYKNRLAYIRESIAKIMDIPSSDERLADKNLKRFEHETFGDNENGKGDLFFDAYPVLGGAGGKLFSYESITPHKTFKDPIPLRLLKVIPDVVFEFRFVINDSKVIKDFTSEKKEQLFEQIITDFGMGAKTNVGFGVMEYVSKEEFEELSKENSANRSKPNLNGHHNTNNEDQNNNNLKRGRVKVLKEKYGFIKLQNGDKDLFFSARNCDQGGFAHLVVGDLVSFIPADGEKGPVAKNVRKVGE